MITNKEIYEEIKNILQTKLKLQLDEEVTDDTNFLKDGLGLDSVMLLELIIELELLYSIELDEDELTEKHFIKANALAQLIQEKIGSRNA